MQNNEGNDENVFVIEVCQNCKDHHWNTRHDQAKYQEYFNRGKLFAVRWLRRIPPPHIFLLTLFLVVASVQLYCGTHPKCDYHEKPDSQVVPALRPVLQPDSERGPESALLPLGATNRRSRGVLPGSCKCIGSFSI